MRLSSCCSAACGFVISALLCAAPVVCAQAQAAPENDKPWTATSQTSGAGGPLRTTESHTKSGNLNVDKQTVEVQGPDGRYQPYLDTETETVQVNATTIRKIVRTYGRDSDGRRNLTQVTEEETQSWANGDRIRKKRRPRFTCPRVAAWLRCSRRWSPRDTPAEATSM